MKPLLLAFLLTGSGLFLGAPAHAQEGVTFEGEVEVTLKNAEYVKVQVNGVDTDNVEFAKNGKLAIIKGLDLEAERTAITLIPTENTLGSASLDVVKKDFKKVRKGKILRFVAKKNVTFPKAEVAPPPAPDTTPKGPDVAPPEPKKDDL
jgi:hypothetical protein